MLTLGYLSCPECGEDAVPSSTTGCPICGAIERDPECHDHVLIPIWTDADGGPCPACGADLRVVVDDELAYAKVRA